MPYCQVSHYEVATPGEAILGRESTARAQRPLDAEHFDQTPAVCQEQAEAGWLTPCDGLIAAVQRLLNLADDDSRPLCIAAEFLRHARTTRRLQGWESPDGRRRRQLQAEDLTRALWAVLTALSGGCTEDLDGWLLVELLGVDGIDGDLGRFKATVRELSKRADAVRRTEAVPKGRPPCDLARDLAEHLVGLFESGARCSRTRQVQGERLWNRRRRELVRLGLALVQLAPVGDERLERDYIRPALKKIRKGPQHSP
jgi:hypothetical protein